MLRVLHILDSLQTGGTEWQCLSLAGHLNQEGYTSQIVCFNPGGPFLETARLMGLRPEVVPFSGFRQLGFVKDLIRLASFMRRHRVQIVQAYGFYSNVPALLSARMAGVPILVASRRDMGEFLTPIMRRVERWIFRLADRVVVNAAAIHHELVATGRVREGKVVVIPTGVDLGRFDGQVPLPDKPVWARKGKVVAMAAKFRRQKDQTTFLRAAKRVLSADPTVAIVLVGDGYLKEPAQRLAEELGIASSVWFVGAVDPSAMPALLQQVDVSVLASKGNEGIPNVILEAMAAGKPVVATDTGGCCEAVRDGVTGFLVPAADANQLAEKILRLLRNDGESLRMGKAGRERVEAEFSLPRMVQRYVSLYETLALEKLGRVT